MDEKRAFFQELLGFCHQKNHELITAFLKNEKSNPDFSLKVFSHILNAHQIWNSRVLGKNQTFGVWEIHSIGDFQDINDHNLQDSRDILERYVLDHEARYENSKKFSFQNRVKDILFHIINHSTYHRGQIAMDFRQKGLEPLVSDYIFHKR